MLPPSGEESPGLYFLERAWVRNRGEGFFLRCPFCSLQSLRRPRSAPKTTASEKPRTLKLKGSISWPQDPGAGQQTLGPSLLAKNTW